MSDPSPDQSPTQALAPDPDPENREAEDVPPPKRARSDSPPALRGSASAPAYPSRENLRNQIFAAAPPAVCAIETITTAYAPAPIKLIPELLDLVTRQEAAMHANEYRLGIMRSRKEQERASLVGSALKDGATLVYAIRAIDSELAHMRTEEAVLRHVQRYIGSVRMSLGTMWYKPYAPPPHE